MAVVENAGGSRPFDSVDSPDSARDLDQSFHQLNNFQSKAHTFQYNGGQNHQNLQMIAANGGSRHAHHRSGSGSGGEAGSAGAGGGEGFKRDMRELEELLSKLNPMAEEFVPPSLINGGSAAGAMGGPGGLYYINSYLMNANNSLMEFASRNNTRRKRNGYNQGKRRVNSRTSMAQREDVIRRTVYVSDIDQQVTEEHLAALFISCGQVVDCRICGDPNSVLRFAFIEFTDEEGAGAALTLAGTMLGYYPVRVLPSKTAIAPVNPTFLPRSEDEREMCARTIYCTNIDKKVSQTEVKLFFEQICGPVYRLRLLGDYHHSTRIAFVEFVMVFRFKPGTELQAIMPLEDRGFYASKAVHHLNKLTVQPKLLKEKGPRFSEKRG